jgi:hypothetical protein
VNGSHSNLQTKFVGLRRYCLRITAFALIFASLVFVVPERGRTQASGSTTTAEIALGIGVLAYLEQYFVALTKSKGSAGQADAIADAPVPLTQYGYFATPPSAGGPPGVIPKFDSPPSDAWTLRKLRDLIIYDIWYAGKNYPKTVALDNAADAADADATTKASAAITAADAASSAAAKAVAAAKSVDSATGVLGRFPPNQRHSPQYVAAQLAYNAAVASSISASTAAQKAQSASTTADAASNNANNTKSHADDAANTADQSNGLAPIKQWRGQFEHLRGCWNQSVAQPSTSSSSPAAQPPSGAGGATQPAAAPNTPPAQTSPPAQTPAGPKPGSSACDLLVVDYPQILRKLPFDQIDFAASFSDTSLYQQVANQDVGSHALNNSFRELLLFAGANELISQSLPPKRRAAGPNATGVTATNYSQLFSASISTSLTFSGALGCAAAVGGIEQALASALPQHDACAFSRGMWMPQFTAIVTKPLTNQPNQVLPFSPSAPDLTSAVRVDFGAGPGC